MLFVCRADLIYATASRLMNILLRPFGESQRSLSYCDITTKKHPSHRAIKFIFFVVVVLPQSSLTSKQLIIVRMIWKCFRLFINARSQFNTHWNSSSHIAIVALFESCGFVFIFSEEKNHKQASSLVESKYNAGVCLLVGFTYRTNLGRKARNNRETRRKHEKKSRIRTQANNL